MDEPTEEKRKTNKSTIQGMFLSSMAVICRHEKRSIRFFTFNRFTPLEWSQIVNEVGTGAPYIGEVLDKGFEICQAVVALFTPDDQAYLRPHLRKLHDPPHEINLTPQVAAQRII